MQDIGSGLVSDLVLCDNTYIRLEVVFMTI
jgi:hypothetical protein